MIRALFGPSSVTSTLRGGLEESMATHRAIASRIAGASDRSGQGGAAAGTAKASKPGEADLQSDMAALADTQIRYEAEAKLLQAAYSRLRSALNSRA